MNPEYTAAEFFAKFSTAYVKHATWSRNKLLNETITEIVSSKHPASIVDFGTGNGELLSLFPHVRIRIGIDVSRPMLRMIRDRNIVRILGDVHSVGLQTASVDFVFCRQVLHYCQPRRVLQQANRILRSDGYVLVVQATDCETIPLAWYAEWKTFKRIKKRRHLTAAAIIHSAENASFELELERRCPVEVQLGWTDLFQKYGAVTRRQQDAISAFFCKAPEAISASMSLKVDSKGICYERAFACLLLRKVVECDRAESLS